MNIDKMIGQLRRFPKVWSIFEVHSKFIKELREFGPYILRNRSLEALDQYLAEVIARISDIPDEFLDVPDVSDATQKISLAYGSYTEAAQKFIKEYGKEAEELESLINQAISRYEKIVQGQRPQNFNASAVGKKILQMQKKLTDIKKRDIDAVPAARKINEYLHEVAVDIGDQELATLTLKADKRMKALVDIAFHYSDEILIILGTVLTSFIVLKRYGGKFFDFLDGISSLEKITEIYIELQEAIADSNPRAIDKYANAMHESIDNHLDFMERHVPKGTRGKPALIKSMRKMQVALDNLMKNGPKNIKPKQVSVLQEAHADFESALKAVNDRLNR